MAGNITAADALQVLPGLLGKGFYLTPGWAITLMPEVVPGTYCADGLSARDEANHELQRLCRKARMDQEIREACP